MLLSQVGRLGRKVVAHWRFCVPATLATGLVLALSACGGGTSQIQAFKPNRLIVFGDENSLLVNDGANNGKKYSVNGLDTNALRDCLLLPLWIQSLSTAYSFAFAECNKDAATPLAFMRARAGARIDSAGTGLAAQLTEQAGAAGGAVRAGDLVTVMLGANDLFELADRVQAGSLTAADALVEAKRRGVRLAELINGVLASGARAIVTTVPDLGYSPYALALDRASPGAVARLHSLSFELNAGLRTSIDPSRFDGRNYGLVLADDLVQSMAKNPAVYALTNVVDGVCVKALPDCTSAAPDVLDGASVAAYLWADDRHLASAAQSRIGTQALARAQGNPF